MMVPCCYSSDGDEDDYGDEQKDAPNQLLISWTRGGRGEDVVGPEADEE